MQTEKVIDHIVSWLKDYLTQAQMNGFVVGISGGIDSAVTSTLCAKTGLRTFCVAMPIHQAPSQVNLAQEHIAHLKKHFSNVTDISIDLTHAFESFQHSLPTARKSSELDLSLANTRARLRMTTLYYFAGLHHYLVAGTGNKIEDFGIGFYTKYGDGGVDLNPLADVLKSEVFELGKELNVPKNILNASPTDGLFGDSRTDEDQLGATYDELEWAMKQHELGKPAESFTGRKRTVFDIYQQLNQRNQHKMQPIPICKIPLNLK